MTYINRNEDRIRAVLDRLDDNEHPTVYGVYVAISGTDESDYPQEDAVERAEEWWERGITVAPVEALVFDDVSDVKASVRVSGSHYFDRASVDFFNGWTDSLLYGGRFWVESIQGPNEDCTRVYQVAYVVPGGPILAVEKLGMFRDLLAARGWARSLAYAVEGTLERL